MDKDTSSYIALGAIVCVALVAIVSIVSLNGGGNTAGVPTWQNKFTGPVPGTGEQTGETYTPCEEGTFKCEDYIRPCDLGDMATGLCEPCTVSPCGASAQQINEGHRRVMQCVENERGSRSLVARLFARWGFGGTPPEITTIWRLKGICPEQTTCTENPPECRDAEGNVYDVLYDWLADSPPDEQQETGNEEDDDGQNTHQMGPGAQDDAATGGPRVKGTGVTNPNSGGSFGCDWENELDLSRCGGPVENDELEVYENTGNCVLQGDEVSYTLYVRGLALPETSPVTEHFSRKQGAEVRIYNYHRSCTSGGEVQNQHDDLIYDCQVYESCTCSLQGNIQCDDDQGGEAVIYDPSPVNDPAPIDEPYVYE